MARGESRAEFERDRMGETGDCKAEPISPGPMVKMAIAASKYSPCRSKRGVVIFAADWLIAIGYNYKPSAFACDGSEACKATCRHEAVHAEQSALLSAGGLARGAELIHVKTIDGVLVTSGGPSCVQCSKLILAAGIAGVWLYQEDGWRRYAAEEFHLLSLTAQPSPPQDETPVNFIHIVPGSARFYCRAEGCGSYSDGNVPYGYCDRHLAQSIAGSPITDKLGFPPIGTTHQASASISVETPQGDLMARLAQGMRNIEVGSANQPSWLFKALQDAAAEIKRLTTLANEKVDIALRQLSEIALLKSAKEAAEAENVTLREHVKTMDALYQKGLSGLEQEILTLRSALEQAKERS